jgi:hypothetical protein
MPRSFDVYFDSFVNVEVPDNFDDQNEEHVNMLRAKARKKYMEMLEEDNNE